MVSKIFAFLALFAVAFAPSALAAAYTNSNNAAYANSSNSTNATTEVDVNLAIQLILDLPDLSADVAEAIATLKANAASIKDLLQAAYANVSSDASTVYEKLQSVVANLKEEIENSTLAADLKAKLVNATATIGAYLEARAASLADTINNGVAKIQAAAAELKVKAEQVKAFLASGLKNVTTAIKNTLVFKYTSLAKQIQAGIASLNSTLYSGSANVNAALAEIGAELQSGSASFLDTLKAFIKSGVAGTSDVVASLGSRLTSAVSTLGGALSNLLNISISASANANTSASGSASGSTSGSTSGSASGSAQYQ
jgi:hypothetical protein